MMSSVLTPGPGPKDPTAAAGKAAGSIAAPGASA